MGLLRSCSRLPAIAVIVAAGLVVAACSSGSSGSNTSTGSTAATSGTSSSTPATTRYRPAQATVIGKSTDVVVNPAVSAALKQAGITVTAIAPATAKTTLLFPVSGGQIVVATLAGTVDHTGGLTFRHSGKSVTLTNFVINTNTKHLTATVGGRSMPIFDLNLASPTARQRPAQHCRREQHQAHRALPGGYRSEQRPRREHIQGRDELRHRDAHRRVRSRAPTSVTRALPPRAVRPASGDGETRTMVVVL